MKSGRRATRLVTLLLAVPMVFVSGMLTVMLVYALVTGVRGPIGGGAATKALGALVTFVVCVWGVRLLLVGAGTRPGGEPPVRGKGRHGGSARSAE